jgi:WD40 repeat protein
MNSLTVFKQEAARALMALFLFCLMLTSAVAEAARLADRAGAGAVMVVVTSKKGAEDYVEYAENTLKGKLKDSGLKVMNPEISEKLKKDRILWEAIKNANASAMAKISTEYGADVLVRSSVAVDSHERFAGSWEGTASLSFTAIDTKTGEEIEALSSDPMGSTENPAPMEDSSLAAKQMAIRKAVDNVMSKMGIASNAELSRLVSLSPTFHALLKSEAGEIRSLAFSPDSRFVAAACDNAVRIWDAEAKTLKLTIDRYSGKATSLAFSKDGALLAIGTSSSDIYLFDAQQGGEKLKIKDAHSKGVWAIDFGPESRILASGGGDGIVRLWDVATGTKLGEMGRHEERIHTLVFDASGRNVMTASNDLKIKYWDVNTKKETRAFAEDMDSLTAAAFSLDRSLVAYGAKTIEIDLMRNRRIDKRFVRLRDTVSGRDLFTFEGHTGDITSIAFLPGKRFLVSSALDKTIKIWDAEKRGEVTSLEQNDKVSAVAASRDGKWLAAGGREKNVMLWKLK